MKISLQYLLGIINQQYHTDGKNVLFALRYRYTVTFVSLVNYYIKKLQLLTILTTELY